MGHPCLPPTSWRVLLLAQAVQGGKSQLSTCPGLVAQGPVWGTAELAAGEEGGGDRSSPVVSHFLPGCTVVVPVVISGPRDSSGAGSPGLAPRLGDSPYTGGIPASTVPA